jgi:integrase/recombinase XerD
MSWRRWVFRFVRDLSVRGLRPRSLVAYSAAVRAFVVYLDAHGLIEPQDLSPAVLEAYQAHLFEDRGARGHRLSLSTQSGRLSAVRAFCRYLTRRGVTLLDPSRDLVLPKVVKKPPRVILTRAETMRFLRSIPVRHLLGVRDRAAFETLYSTGLRVGELVRLVPADLDLDAGFLCVRAGKGGRARVVPLGRVAVEWIRRYLELTRRQRGPTDPVFVSQRGTPLIPHHLSARARALARHAGIDKRVTCHSFRHACATHMLQGRASLRHIQEMLGHATPTSTQIYAQVTIQDLKRVHQRCHPRNRE